MSNTKTRTSGVVIYNVSNIVWDTDDPVYNQCKWDTPLYAFPVDLDALELNSNSTERDVNDAVVDHISQSFAKSKVFPLYLEATVRQLTQSIGF